MELHILSAEHQSICVQRSDDGKTQRYVSFFADLGRRRNSNLILQSAKRTRVREKEDYRYLLVLYQSHLSQISELEERVEALAQMLRDAGIDVPPETVGAVQQNVGGRQTTDSNARTEELFEELMGALSKADSHEGEGSSQAAIKEDE